MPTRPASFRPGRRPDRAALRKDYDRKRREAKPWRALYKTARWKAIRERVLAASPLCGRCLAEGVIEPATVVNHVERHHGDPERFFAGPFEAICKPHHDRDVQREERAAERRDG